MAKANPYSHADQHFELIWSVLMMLVLFGALGLGTVRFLQVLRSLAVSMPHAPFFDGTL